jgi:hypothetical protein
MKTRLLQIINKGANKLTKDDKIFITMCAEELRQKAPAGSCRSCYIDTAVFLVQEIERQEERAKEVQELEKLQPKEATTEEVEAPAEPATTERKILIKKGVDIIVNGVRVNRYTITTDAQAEALLKIIDRKYFEIL